jgi:hypothetical protein
MWRDIFRSDYLIPPVAIVALIRYKREMMPRPRIFPRWFSRARRSGAKRN